MNKFILSRSRRALGSAALCSSPFGCLVVPASPAFPHQRDFALRDVSERYFMLKFNGEMLTSHRNGMCQNKHCSNRLNFALRCGGSCLRLTATSWHILMTLCANSAPLPFSPMHRFPAACPAGHLFGGGWAWLGARTQVLSLYFRVPIFGCISHVLGQPRP